MATEDRARLIVFVGIDGSGKTTQAGLLAERLTAAGVACGYLRHESLSGVKGVLDSIAREEGYEDSPSMLGEDVIRLSSAIVKLKSLLNAAPLMAQSGYYVVIDRYSYCQYAAAKATGPTNALLLRRMFAQVPDPDLTLFIDVPPEEAAQRVLLRGIDADDVSFLSAFDKAYKALPEADRFTLIDGRSTEDTVQESVWAAVLDRFPELSHSSI